MLHLQAVGCGLIYLFKALCVAPGCVVLPQVVVYPNEIQRFTRDPSAGTLDLFDTTSVVSSAPVYAATADPAGDFVVSTIAVVSRLVGGN